MQSAVLSRHHRLEKAGLAQGPNSRAACRIDIVVRQRWKDGVGPPHQLCSKATVAFVEERPDQRVVQGIVKRHRRCLPANPGGGTARHVRKCSSRPEE